ncbi:histidine kinase [Roseivirga ehrenbergii]|uniref:Signal transduction histidine kinase internal region domain-containing protein n=1 Tax=Roseivirga ehrenbergii (strain DSM 102268 / JCM 13514 / KCTC 12282 / NCIMB 14502 / KMM 6017) TaxID=279360 RepID=A0A150XSF2_ROSEK|nr:sensor histidine kinase [Roseivirga ehrenbergii]KYG81653.1 hypothetical protein MB14_13810 [Roseivirga ehrenbergii]TCL10828.1 histidine kinase [Roseivirga ehrenbergii]
MKKNLLDQPLFRITVPPIYGLMMYFLILLLNNSLAQITDTVLTQELLLCVVLAFLTSESLRLTIVLFEKKVGHELRRTGNITLLFFTSLLISAAIIFAAVYYYFSEIEGNSYFVLFKSNLIKLVSIYSISGLLYTLFYLSIYFLSVKNETEIKREDLKRQNLEHQLEIFNNEINPSLLFQSLETLISLVHHNIDAAEDFVDRLSLVYRYILDNRKKELVKVEDELQATKNLFLLFKEKYPEQISLTIAPWTGEKGKLLVPNSLPMLLDCVVNSTIISGYQPLNIRISFDEEGYLVLQYQENDKLSLDAMIKKRHKNLHQAFAYFSDKPVIQIKAYGDAFIKLPLLELKEEL